MQLFILSFYLVPAIALLIVGTYATKLDLSHGVSFTLTDLIRLILFVITPVLNIIILVMLLQEMSEIGDDIVLIKAKK